MTFKVVNKKTGNEGVAVDLGNGRFAIEITADEKPNKEVAASTFKRWYTVVEELNAPLTEEQLKRESEKIEEDTGLPVAPPKEEKVEEPEVKVGDVVTFSKEGYMPVGKVTGILNGTATVLTVTVDGDEEEVPVGLGELTVETDEKTIKKGLAKLEKESKGNTPKEEKKPVRSPQRTPRKPRFENAAKEVLLGIYTDAEGIDMIDRQTEVFNSKYGKLPKYIDTYKFYGFRMVMAYNKGAGSLDVKLYSQDGKLLFKSPNGTLKPVMEILNFGEEQMKETRRLVREERKAWEFKESEQK